MANRHAASHGEAQDWPLLTQLVIGEWGKLSNGVFDREFTEYITAHAKLTP